MLYDSNKMDYKDGYRQIYAYYKMVQFIISARDENVEHDTHNTLNGAAAQLLSLSEKPYSSKEDKRG